MLRLTMALFAIASAACLWAQEAATDQGSPQMRLNMVQVCSPSDAEKGELRAALARIPEKPALAADFEVARGRTTTHGVASDWVRLRREFSSDASLSNVQFLLALTSSGMTETLVFHFKATKTGEPLQLALSNEISAGSPDEVLQADTPPGHIRLERFGKSSLILARCPNVDQGGYAPLFQAATERFVRFRAALQVRATVSAELARLRPGKAISPQHAKPQGAGELPEKKRTN